MNASRTSEVRVDDEGFRIDENVVLESGGSRIPADVMLKGGDALKFINALRPNFLYK